MAFEESTRALALDPPIATQDIPCVQASFKNCPEDFRVNEIPSYDPDGQEEAHLLLLMTKRDWNTESAIGQVARQLDIPRMDVGIAGQKDRFAVTTQWITVPWACKERLSSFEHDAISLGEAFAHGNKLRRGHLKGNEFRVVLRDLEPGVSVALDLFAQKLSALSAGGGLENYFGPQRFGYEGANLERGLKALAKPTRVRRGDLMVSALQSGLFNLYLLRRREQGLLRTVLLGDLLRKTETGGLFESTEPEIDQQRFDSGEVELTGPIFGSKMRGPTLGTPSGELETRILQEVGIDEMAFKPLGKKGPGTRRSLQLPSRDVRLDEEPSVDDLTAGIALEFTLPAGSFATRLIREFCEF
jgi:tRNA pseudouridine13 synthase